MQVAGCLICEGNDCLDEEREYFSTCDICGITSSAVQEADRDFLCDECRAKAKMLS